MIPSVRFSPGWIRNGSRSVSWSGARGWRSCCPGEVVAIDGKTVRRSHDTRGGKGALHLVSAWASANTLTLGQVKTEEKSNEIHRHTQVA